MAEATIRFRYAKTVKMPFVASQKRKERGFMAVPKDYNEQIKEIEKKEAQLKAQKRILKARQNKKAREERTRRLLALGETVEACVGCEISDLEAFGEFLRTHKEGLAETQKRESREGQAVPKPYEIEGHEITCLSEWDGLPIKSLLPEELRERFRTEPQWRVLGLYPAENAKAVEMHPMAGNRRICQYYLDTQVMREPELRE